MLTSEILENGTRIRFYSDAGFKIRQIETGVIYEDAVHNVPAQYTYEETSEPIEDTDPTPEEALDILLGGAWTDEEE